MQNVSEHVTKLAAEISLAITSRGLVNPLMIGIRSGGVWIANLLHQQLALQEPLGLLDISFYRDDFSQIGVHPNVKPSQLPVHIEGRDIILVDDVFYTGRTSRAAVNEIFDYGRPKQILLAVLIERDGKQIPMQPDCVGLRIKLNANRHIKFIAEPLSIDIQ